MNADGSGVTQLTDSPGVTWWLSPLSWSPDGTRLAAVRVLSSRENKQEVEIYIINADRSGAAAVTSVTDSLFINLNPQWSPDGRHVYVEGTGTNVVRVALADLRVERVLELADLGPTVKGFVFDGLTPDGSLLLDTGWGSSDIHALQWRIP